MSGPDQSWRDFSGVGIQFTVTVLFCTWLGHKMDEWLNIEPFGVLFGIFFGIFAAMYNLIKTVDSLKKK